MAFIYGKWRPDPPRSDIPVGARKQKKLRFKARRYSLRLKSHDYTFKLPRNTDGEHN